MPGVGVGTTVLIERMRSRKSSLMDLDCKISGVRQDANAMTPGQRQRALATIATERLAVAREPVFYAWLSLDQEEMKIMQQEGACQKLLPACVGAGLVGRGASLLREGRQETQTMRR